MHLKSKKLLLFFVKKWCLFINSVLDLYKDGEKYLKAMQNYASAMQTICKCIASGMQNDAKKSKAKKSKAKKIKTNKIKYSHIFLIWHFSGYIFLEFD